MMSPEKMPHTPEIKTTPERVLEEAGKEAEVSKERLSPEEIEVRVTELADLSAARPEVSKHVRETWGGLTKKEREELKAKGEEAVIAHLESLKVDPELREFEESTLSEYDERIKELASHPDVLTAYKDRFETLKGTLAKVLAFDHLQKELRAAENTEQKLRIFYEQYGRSPGPIERKKLEGLANRVTELKGELQGFELDEPTIDMLRRREIRGMQRDLARYSFAETESRTELIREVLPDLMQGAPVLFQGETGSGKTQLAKYISQKHLGKEPAVISVSEQIKESQILGTRGLDVIIKTLREQVFRDIEWPEEYEEAIREFEANKDRLTKLMSENWQQAAKELSELKISQLTRQSIQETIYDLALYYDKNGKRLLPNVYTWSNSRSSGGYLVVLGDFGARGVRGHGWTPDNRYGDLGVLLSRRL